MKNLIWILFVIALIKCDYSNGDSAKVFNKNLNVKPISNSFKYTKDNFKMDSLTFEYENDTILQRLELTYISKLKIKFILSSVNKKSKIKSQLEGIAMREDNSNAGTNEDENGLSYLVTEYNFEKKECWLSIDIGGELKDDKVQISESNCEKEHNRKSPFASVGILRKVNK